MNKSILNLNSNRGFSLLELLIAMSLFSVIMSVMYSTYANFMRTTKTEEKINRMNTEVNTGLAILERDIKMAGFALPKSTRVASDNNCNINDNTFCVNNTDRLFLGDGWEVLKDFTLNQEVDGNILDADYVKIIGGNGFNAVANPIAIGDGTVKVDDLNIDNGIERNDPDASGEDIKANQAIIISDNVNTEGHRTTIISATLKNITLLANDLPKNKYTAVPNSIAVVPALAWHVRETSGIQWLFRNEDRVIPYVQDFQVRYGYDSADDGIQWEDNVPPGPGISIDGNPFEFDYLKRIEVIVSVSDCCSSIINNYTINVLLRN